jgi:hypothetical protein
MSSDAMTLFSLLEAALLVGVLAFSLMRVRARLSNIEKGLGALGGALSTVESQHLRPLGQMVANINAPLVTIMSVLPGIAAKAAFVVRKVTGG